MVMAMAVAPDSAPDWDRVQQDARAGVYGEWSEVRDSAVDYLLYDCGYAGGDDGIGSSDVNHVVYSLVRMRVLVERA